MVIKEQVWVFVCTCGFCGHVWKVFEVPKRCAKCKKLNWDRGSPPSFVEEEPALVQTLEKDKKDLFQAILDISRPKHSDRCTCLVCKPPRESK